MTKLNLKIGFLVSLLHFCLLTSSQNVVFDDLRGRQSVKIPFEFKNNFIIISARLNNVLPVNLIFDTGAQHSLIFKKLYTDILGAEYERRLKIMGSDLSQELYALVTRRIHMNVEDVVDFTKDLLVLEEDYFKLDEITGTRIDGLLGGETFKHFVVHIDYRKQFITLIRKSEFKPPGTRKFDQIPLDVQSSKPFLDADVVSSSGTPIRVNILLDTGAGIPILLYTNTHEELTLPEKTITGKLGKGLGGFLEGYLGRLQQAQIGEFQLNNMVASFQQLDSLGLIRAEQGERNGLIGNQLLSRFEMYIDYPGSTLYLKKEKGFNEAFEYDRSGMTVLAVGPDLRDFIVNSIIEGSAADKTGVQRGDIIKRIRGIPTYFLTLTDISRIFQKKAGKKIKLTLDRNGEKIKKVIILEDLF